MADRLWRLAPGLRLHLHRWDGDTVLYNNLSGATHQLDDAGLALLRALESGPCAEPELTDHLRRQFDLAPAASDLDETRELLEALRMLHLIVPC